MRENLIDPPDLDDYFEDGEDLIAEITRIRSTLRGGKPAPAPKVRA